MLTISPHDRKESMKNPPTFATLEALTRASPTFRKCGSLQVANRTKLRRLDEDTFAIKYWRTDVVLVHRNGTYTLNTDGHRTPTTLRRIVEFSPLHTLRFESIKWRGNLYFYNGVGDTRLFHDGIRVDSEGRLVPRRGDPLARCKITGRREP